MVSLSQKTHAQDSVIATFEKTEVRIAPSIKKQVETIIKVKVKRNDRLQNCKVMLSINETLTTLSSENIFMPADNIISIDNSKDPMEKTFKILMIRDDTDDRNVSLSLLATDAKGKPVPIKKGKTNCEIYIKPIGKSSEDMEEKPKDSIYAVFSTIQIRKTSNAQQHNVETELKVRVAKNDKLKNYKVRIDIDANNSSQPLTKVDMPADNTFVIDNSKDTMEKVFKILVDRDENDDKILTVNLSAQDDKGNVAYIFKGKTSCEVYIKPVTPDSVTQGKNQFWLFAGTNLDLLDGVKARDLYFKGSFLFNVPFEENSKWWLYTTFGQNRYFSQADSFKRLKVTDGILDPHKPDSISLVNGYYSTSRQIVTQNTYLSVSILRELFSTKTNQVLGLFEGYYGSQNITHTYSNYDFNTDTVLAPYKKDSGYRFSVAMSKQSIIQANYNIGLGLMWIYNTDDLNIKFQALCGYNLFNYPYASTSHGVSQTTFYRQQQNAYGQFRLEANVVKPAGISLGVEMFIRQGQFPLWNISISKLLDFRHVANLFTPVKGN